MRFERSLRRDDDDTTRTSAPAGSVGPRLRRCAEISRELERVMLFAANEKGRR